MGLRLSGYWLLIVLLSGCGPRISPDELPALPSVSTENFLPAISDQLDRLSQAVIDDPLDAEKSGRLGMAYLVYTLDDAAEVAFHRARLLQPGNFQWMYYHAEVLTRLGRLEESVSVFQDAVASKPAFVPARIHLGLLHMQLGDFDTAAPYLIEVVKDEPENSEGRLALAQLYLRADEPEKARTHLEYVIDKAGPSGRVYFALADALRRLGEDEQADRNLALFERYRAVALPIEDTLLKAVADMDRSEKPLLRDARRLNQQGKTAEAMDLLHRALERNPNSHLTHAALVGAYGALKQFDKVDEHYRLALESAPATAALLRNVGRARFYEERLTEAGEALEQALELNPHDASALTWLGLTRMQQKKTEVGIAFLTEALEKNPRESMARHNLVNILRKQGRHADAIVHMKELVVVEDRHSPRVWREMGESYRQLGQVAEARKALAAAVSSAKRLNDDLEARRSANVLQSITE